MRERLKERDIVRERVEGENEKERNIRYIYIYREREREIEKEIEKERERRNSEGVILYFILLFFRDSTIPSRHFGKIHSLPCLLTVRRPTIRVF